MDAWGIIIFVAGVIGYFAFKRKAGFLFVAGVGAGIFIGSIWAMILVNQVFARFGM